jgi:hypothetical protein
MSAMKKSVWAAIKDGYETSKRSASSIGARYPKKDRKLALDYA